VASSTGINREERGTNLNKVAWFIENLKEIIIQQNNIIGKVIADFTEIKSEQQILKNQNIELQEEVRSLRTQFSVYFVSLPSSRS
jgi:hypothetical protein